LGMGRRTKRPGAGSISQSRSEKKRPSLAKRQRPVGQKFSRAGPNRKRADCHQRFSSASKEGGTKVSTGRHLTTDRTRSSVRVFNTSKTAYIPGPASLPDKGGGAMNLIDEGKAGGPRRGKRARTNHGQEGGNPPRWQESESKFQFAAQRMGQRLARRNWFARRSETDGRGGPVVHIALMFTRPSPENKRRQKLRFQIAGRGGGGAAGEGRGKPIPEGRDPRWAIAGPQPPRALKEKGRSR